jgi:hypothetical protein
MKKYTKILKIICVYILFTFSFTGIVYGTSSETGTLYQTIGAGVDTISVTDAHHLSVNYNLIKTSNYNSTLGWNGVTQNITWQIQSGAQTAYIKLESSALADTPDVGHNDLTLLYAYTTIEPFDLVTQNMSGCDGSYPTSWNEVHSTPYLMYNQEVTLWQAVNCNNLAGKWRGQPFTRITIPVNTPPSQYTGTMTATLSTE